jgi:tRNA(Ser,Leu) C12 N-acetylase TAN1
MNLLEGKLMPDVVLTRVEFLPSHDLDELEKSITELLEEFERKHKGTSLYAEIEILSK